MEQLQAADEVHEEIYQHILEDIERVIAVIPVKTKAQKQVDELRLKVDELKATLDFNEMMFKRLESNYKNAQSFADDLI